MEKTYAQALHTLSQKDGADPKQLVASLVAQLTRTGRMKLLPGILRELSRIEARAKTTGPHVEAATEAELATALTEAAAHGITNAQGTVNPDLIQGWRARSGDTLVDRSGKRALTDLYQAITKHT